MPVSPTTGSGNSCGDGLLPDTTSRYLVGSAVYDQYQQFGSDGSSPPKRTGHRSLPRHSGGRLRRNESLLGVLVGRVRPGMKANGRRSFRHPRNPAGHKTTTTTREVHTVPSGKGTQKRNKPEARAEVEEGATRLDRKQQGEWRKLSDGEFMVGAHPLLIPNAKGQDQSLGEEALRGKVA